jgi:hypothetical protein
MKDASVLILRESIGSVTQIEQKASKVGRAFRKILETDEQTLAKLDKVAAVLTSLQAQLTELAELNHLLHDILTALAPFRLFLAAGMKDGLDATGHQVLFQNWRPCQRCVDRLADFSEEIEGIGHPLQRDGRELEGERWSVDIIALQVLVEDALKEDDLDAGNLFELTEELDNTCRGHLTMVDRKLKAVADGAQRLSEGLFGGGDE